MTWTKPKIEHNIPTKWNWVVSYPENLVIGMNVDIGAFTYIQAEVGITIEDDVQIGSHCSIYSVSTIDDKKGKVTIGHNARIGTHSTIMPGIIIGENAVVGAHSFVNRDVPSNVVWYGLPAREPYHLPEDVMNDWIYGYSNKCKYLKVLNMNSYCLDCHTPSKCNCNHIVNPDCWGMKKSTKDCPCGDPLEYLQQKSNQSEPVRVPQYERD